MSNAVFASVVTAFTTADGGISFPLGVDFDTASVLLPAEARDRDYNGYYLLAFTGGRRYQHLEGKIWIRNPSGRVDAAPEGVGVSAMITAFKWSLS